jgi:carbamoyl-phosphate synthase large subunit
MLSTGEVACLGNTFADAFSTALQSADFKIPPKEGSVLITVGGEQLKMKMVPLAMALKEMGFKIYATKHTAEALRDAGVNNVSVLHKVRETDMSPNIVEYLQEGKIDMVINIPMGANHSVKQSDVLRDEYIIRRMAVEFNVPVVTNIELASALVKVLKQCDGNGGTVRSLNEYMDSLKWKFW